MADQAQASQPMFPIWAIVIIIVVVIALIAMAVFCMKKRRSRSLSVDTIHRKEDEKKSMSTSSFQTLVTQKQQKTVNPKSETSSSSITTSSLPHATTTPPALPASPATAKKTATMTPQSNEKTDPPASDYHQQQQQQHTASDYYPPPEPPQEIKISLPLPPPSTSFFSDKMELDGEDAQDFYAMYLNSKSKQDNSFISIDLDMPSFYSNVQQKAATIKSTLRQSLRVKQKSNRNSVQQLFAADEPSSSSSSSSKAGQDAIITHAIVPLKQQESPKVVIDMNPPPQQDDSINIVTQQATTATSDEADESPITPNPNLQEPVRAAKRVIRSASRKTKTRSMVITTDPVSTGTENSDENGNGRRSKHGSIRYASIRGPKSNGEHMTITSGSMRRLVRESILFDDDALPLPSSAAIAAAPSSSTTTTATTKKSVVDIAGWWDATPKSTATLNTAATTTTTEHVNENQLPLNITSGLDSTSSNTPNQYRASLSASIFAGTLSKASGSNASLLSDLKDDSAAANSSNGGVSRHGSFRRGTLGRNTLRSITATATHGVNKSLKGLFDYSSSTSLSNKVVPDNSQKMELDSEPAIAATVVVSTAAEGATTKDDPPAPAPAPLSVIRQKSMRTSTSSSNSSSRPVPPVSYLKTSESSTKYALSDEDDQDSFNKDVVALLDRDESSQKTALDDMAHPESPTLPQGHYDLPSGSNKVEAAPSSIEETSAQRCFADNSSMPCSAATQQNKGEVDTIRRMLQDTWINNMKESASNYSMLSDADSVATTSTQSTVSSKLAPPRQQQSLLSKSLLTQQVAKRASLLARHNGEEEFVPQQGPEPSASFSSSTVRTMVPANESAGGGSLSSEPVAIRQNAISSKMHGSNKIQESSYDDNKSHHLMSRFSTSPMTDTSAISSSPRNSSADSSRGHSRKSSGGNSAATALRISSGYSVNAKTWNGRAQKRANNNSINNKSSVTQGQDFVSPDDSLGRSSVNKKFFSTMRKGQKTRGNIPWMMAEEQDSSSSSSSNHREKTPAQIERDRYLEGGGSSIL
ncbi:hypothetical protein MBANPS3_003383 [Mucor bainieri]